MSTMQNMRHDSQKVKLSGETHELARIDIARNARQGRAQDEGKELVAA